MSELVCKCKIKRERSEKETVGYTIESDAVHGFCGRPCQVEIYRVNVKRGEGGDEDIVILSKDSIRNLVKMLSFKHNICVHDKTSSGHEKSKGVVFPTCRPLQRALLTPPECPLKTLKKLSPTNATQ